MTATSPTNDQRPAWSWSSAGGNGQFRFKLNDANLAVGATTTNATSYAPPSNLSEGNHTFYIQEQQGGGGWSPTRSLTVEVDITKPAMPSVSAVSPTNSTQPTWNWLASGGGNGTFRFRLDNPILTAEVPTSSLSFTPGSALSAGNHTVYVQERDAAGNWSDAGSYQVTVDLTPPSAPVVSTTARVSTVRPTWTWVAGGGAGAGTYRYKIDDPDLSAGATETTLLTATAAADLMEGSHTLYVEERDAAGNWSTAGSATSTIDLTPPNTPSVSGTTPVMTLRPTWTWATGGDGAGSYRYSLDSSDMSSATQTSATTFTPGSDLLPTAHTLYVQEQDDVGNWSETASHVVLIDTTPPGAPVVTGVSPTNALRPTWTWGAAGGGNGTYRYKLDSSDFSSGSTTTTGSSYSPGADLSAVAHTLYVQERDVAGNWSATGSFAITIDVTPPSAPVVTTNAYHGTLETYVTWYWNYGNGNGTFRYKLDDADLTTGATLTTNNGIAINPIPADGPHTLYVQTRDAAGNWSASGSATTTIDRVVPVVTMTSPPAGSYVNSASQAAFTIEGTCSEDGPVSVDYTGRVGIAQTVTCSGGLWSKTVNWTSQADGEVAFFAQQVDAAQNYGTQVSRTFVKDTVPPPTAGIFFSPNHGAGPRGVVSIQFERPAELWPKYEVYRGLPADTSGAAAAPSSCSGTLVRTLTEFPTYNALFYDWTGSPNKYFKYRICVYDAAGNSASVASAYGLASSGATVLRAYDARDIDGNGTANSGSINATAVSSWKDLGSAYTCTLTGFNANTAPSGWDGDGTWSTPYKLKFDGVNDYAYCGHNGMARAYGIWFYADTVAGGTKQLYRRDVGGVYSEAWLSGHILGMQFNGGGATYAAVSANEWHHLAVIGDNGSSKMRWYLDGRVINEQAARAETGSSVNFYVGAAAAGTSFFDGAIADIKLWSASPGQDEIQAAYTEGKKRFTSTPGALTIDRVDASTSPSSTFNYDVDVFGHNFQDVQSVSINGVKTGYFRLISPNHLAVRTTSIATPGYYDLTVTDLTTSVTMPKAVHITKTPTDNVNLWLDANNPAGRGSEGSAASTTLWRSQMLATGDAALVNFDYNASSGWQGNGTIADPNRLKFDGVDDCVRAGGGTAKSLSLWFAPNFGISGQQHLLADSGTAEVYVSATSLTAIDNLNSRSVMMTETWNHFAMTNNGTTTTYYLNGEPFAALASTASLTGPLYIGCDVGYATFFNGSFGEVRSYSDALTAAEVRKIFAELRDNYYGPSPLLSVWSLSGAVSAPAGGSTFRVYGDKVESATSVTVGGQPASFTAESSHVLLVTTPAGTVGWANVVVSNGTTTVTVPNGVRYTATPFSTLQVFYDATSLDTLGTVSVATSRMKNLVGSNHLISGYGGAPSSTRGANGNGTVASPYRWQFASGYSLRNYIPPTTTHSVWFKPADLHPGADGSVFYTQQTSDVTYVDGILSLRYNNSYVQVPASAGKWHHLTMSPTAFYLNGELVASHSSGVESIGGSFNFGPGFNGAFASYRSYTSNLTAAEVRSIYHEEKYRFTTDPGVVTVERVSGGPSPLAGGASLRVHGSQFKQPLVVTVGGASATVTVESESVIIVTTPARSAGWHDLVVTTNTGSDTATKAVLYTAAPVTNIDYAFEAGSINGGITPAVGVSTSDWQSLSSSKTGLLKNFDFNIGSGWAGTGTTADPFALAFDGLDDRVTLWANGAATYSVWFKWSGSGHDTIFHRSFGSRAYIFDNVLYATYNDSAFFNVGITSEEWHHLAITNDGTTGTFYLDGVSFGSGTIAALHVGAVESGSAQLDIGASPQSVVENFHGQIGSFRTYTTSLTAANVRALYTEGRMNYFADPGVPKVDKVIGSHSATGGGGAFTLFGRRLLGNTNVTINAASSTARTVESDGVVSATAPARAAGWHDLVAVSAAGNSTISGGFNHTATVLTNILTRFDATNIDAAGARGGGSASPVWQSLANGAQGALTNFAFDATSGWLGDGTTASPYRLRFSGGAECVKTGTNAARTYTVWFKPEGVIDANQQGLFHAERDGTATTVYLQSGAIYVVYAGGAVRSTTITTDTWHQLTLIHNGTSVTSYLDKVAIGTAVTVAAENGPRALLIGCNTNGASFKGAIAEFRTYSTNITTTQNTAMWTELDARVP